MKESQRLKILVESGRTVFTPLDLRLLWREKPLNCKINAVRMTNGGLLVRLSRGYYVLNENYNPYELANRIVSPSYVSFQAALTSAGNAFQAGGEIGSVAGLNYRKTIDGMVYSYVAMKDLLFHDREGVLVRDGVSLASPERAILDSLYFGYLPDVSNPEALNKTLLARLSTKYPKTIQLKARGWL
jgi:hypothetical protein